MRVRGVASTFALNVAVASQLRCAAAAAAGVGAASAVLARVTDTVTGYVAVVPPTSKLNTGSCGDVYGDAAEDAVWFLPPNARALLGAPAPEQAAAVAPQQAVRRAGSRGGVGLVAVPPLGGVPE